MKYIPVLIISSRDYRNTDVFDGTNAKPDANESIEVINGRLKLPIIISDGVVHNNPLNSIR